MRWQIELAQYKFDIYRQEKFNVASDALSCTYCTAMTDNEPYCIHSATYAEKTKAGLRTDGPAKSTQSLAPTVRTKEGKGAHRDEPAKSIESLSTTERTKEVEGAHPDEPAKSLQSLAPTVRTKEGKGAHPDEQAK
ncbi:Hypothetical predicted protein [Octopus vulgaris]|uniref:Uncharacterized protein n=1 Tax=Octopus vulgaris TaxID=6645 RepID=A0AA36FEI8_OCTVU|nr:Hypothetical predicted protein [Octopus vulgaris]